MGIGCREKWAREDNPLLRRLENVAYDLAPTSIRMG